MNQTQPSSSHASGRTGDPYPDEAAPSYRPILVAFSITLLAIGVIFNPVVSAVGLLLLLINIAGWVQENRDAQSPQEDHDGQDA